MTSFGAELTPALFGQQLDQAFALTPEAQTIAAIGDGVADDYAAFQALAAAINAAGGGRVQCARGKTYLLDRNLVSGNGVSDIKFTGCNGLIIDLNGSTIKLKGNWDRDVASTRALCGLRVQDSSNVIVRNGEIYGSSDTITNSAAAAPGYSHGLSIESCVNVTVDNINSHHHTADGLRLDVSPTIVGGKYIACKNVIFRNCISKFSARLGLSLIQARGVRFENCDLSFTAFNDEVGTATTFANGGAPKAGLDIEPNYLTTSSPTPVDVQTGDITFDTCRIKGNSSSSLLAQAMTGGVHRMDQVHFINCDIDHVDGQIAAGTGLAFDVPDGSITGCRIDMRDSTLYFPWNGVSIARQNLVDNFIYGRMSATGVFQGKQGTGGNCMIRGNTFNCTNTVAGASGTRFLRNLNTFSDVLANRIVMPAAAYADFTGTDLMIVCQIDGKRAEGNRYETDLLAAAGSSGTACFGVMYGDNTIVRGEKFVGAAPGYADTIQPGRKTAGTQIVWDTSYLFNGNQRMLKVSAFDPGSTALAASSALQSATIPDAALGAKVDVIFQADCLGMTFKGYVSVAGTVKWFHRNDAGANPLDLAAADVVLTVTNPTL